MRKRRYGLAYLLVMILPIITVYFVYHFIDFNLDIIQGIVLGFSFMIAGEINAKYQSKRLIWGYISNSVRNKIAFIISMAFFLYWFVYPDWYDIYLPFQSKMIWIIVCVLSSFLMFILLVTRDLRLTILRKFIPRRSETK
jgi:hypothetical protein